MYLGCLPSPTVSCSGKHQLSASCQALPKPPKGPEDKKSSLSARLGEHMATQRWRGEHVLHSSHDFRLAFTSGANNPCQTGCCRETMTSIHNTPGPGPGTLITPDGIQSDYRQVCTGFKFFFFYSGAVDQTQDPTQVRHVYPPATLGSGLAP
jgi:hypothetical protein